MVHEVVVRNRLEELRKRQRDDALHAQQELLGGAGTSNKGSSLKATEATPTAEPYHRSMSPPLIDITKLPLDERNIDIVTPKDQLRSLVGLRFFLLSSTLIFP